MSGQDNPYSRLYHSVKADDRFDHVFSCDPCWAAYTRLLIDAEAAYPVAASLPISLRSHAKTQLEAAGIIELRPHNSFIVHGLEAERKRRSRQGHAGAAARWNTPTDPAPECERNANALQTQCATENNAMLDETRRDETSLDKTRRAETSAARTDEPEAKIEQQLARWSVYGVPLGAKLRGRLALLVEDHGEAKVLAACERIHAVPKPPHDASAYVWGAVDALEAKPGRKPVAVIVTDPDTDYDAGMTRSLPGTASLAREAALLRGGK